MVNFLLFCIVLCILCDITYLNTIKKNRKCNFLLVLLPVFPGVEQLLLIIHRTVSFSDLKEPEAINVTKETSSHGLLFYEGASLHFLTHSLSSGKLSLTFRSSLPRGGCCRKKSAHACKSGLGFSRFFLNWVGYLNSEMKYQEADFVGPYVTFFNLAFF